MSTLTDLFNLRIGFAKKGVCIEQHVDQYTVYRVGDQRLPARQQITYTTIMYSNLYSALVDMGIEKEDIYVVLHPSHYYRTTHQFPFSEPQKIDAVLSNEVRMLLPIQDEEIYSDYLQVGEKTVGYTVTKSEILTIIEALGSYRKNLKALIPYEVALVESIRSCTNSSRMSFIDIHGSDILITNLNGGSVRSLTHITCHDDEELKDILTAVLITLRKSGVHERFFSNVRTDAEQKVTSQFQEVSSTLGFSVAPLPMDFIENSFPFNETDQLRDMMILAGALIHTRTPKGKLVNLLKGEFKPSLRGYVSVKNFVLLGVLLGLLLGVMSARFFIDISTKQSQIEVLRKAVKQLSTTTFGDSIDSPREALAKTEELEKRIDLIKRNIDHRNSGLKILQDFSLALPTDVMLEYSDLKIDRTGVILTGKTNSFSDIDAIQKALQKSGYFSDIKVVNSGTTGSSGGLTVTFQIEAHVKKHRVER